MLELFSHVLAKDFRHLDVARARIVLVDAADRILGGLSPASSATAQRVLTKRGVEVITGVGVEAVEADAVDARRRAAASRRARWCGPPVCGRRRWPHCSAWN